MVQLSLPLLVTLLGLLAVAGLLIRHGKIPIVYNLRNLALRWKTTLMTALAFTLVVALLMLMMAFVNGMYRLTDGSGQPDNVVVLSEGVTDEIFSNLGFSDISDIENQPGVRRENGQPLCSRETYLVVNQPIPNAPPHGPQRRFLQMRGVEEPEVSGRVHGVALHAGGRWFSQAGVQKPPSSSRSPNSSRPAVEVVLGEGIARQLAEDRTVKASGAEGAANRLDVGDAFALADRQWLVVGVMQSSGSTFDSEVWAKQAIIGPMFGKETCTSLVLRAKDVEQAGKLKDYFNHDFKKAAVQAMLEPEYFASLSETNRQFLVGIVFITLVMAAGGVFGVMNTMFAAISQRTEDIGVLRVLGYARWQILSSFLLESLALGLAGGLLGCAIGSLCDGWGVTSIVGSHAGGAKLVVLQLAVTANTWILGLLLSLAMGAIGGLLPAISAMRLRPLEALR